MVVDYEGTGATCRFQAQVASVEAMGYERVATGYGLSLLRKLSVSVTAP